MASVCDFWPHFHISSFTFKFAANTVQYVSSTFGISWQKLYKFTAGYSTLRQVEMFEPAQNFSELKRIDYCAGHKSLKRNE